MPSIEDPEWKEFEKFVQQIENLVIHTDVVVRHDDKMLCSITGTQRQIDVTITLPARLGSGVIAIECRKRDKLQDRKWLEQLHTKFQSLPVNSVVAVSMSGFDGVARKVADHYGIILRKLSEINSEDIDAWTGKYLVQSWGPAIKRANYLKFYDIYGHTIPKNNAPSDLVRAICSHDDLDRKLVYGENFGRRESLLSLIKQYVSQSYPGRKCYALSSDENSPTTEKMFALLCDDSYFFIGAKNSVQVRVIEACFDLYLKTIEGPAIQQLKYVNPSENNSEDFAVVSIKNGTSISKQVVPAWGINMMESMSKKKGT